MKVSLVRHGRPAADLATRISGHSFGAWLDHYEAAGTVAASEPPARLRIALQPCDLVASSPVRRARTSAERLRLDAPHLILPEAREAPLPRTVFFPVATRPTTLCVIARILWNCRLARAPETVSEVSARASLLAQSLTELAAQHGHVALVGHGYLNRLVQTQLAREGWRCAEQARGGYWAGSHWTRD